MGCGMSSIAKVEVSSEGYYSMLETAQPENMRMIVSSRGGRQTIHLNDTSEKYTFGRSATAGANVKLADDSVSGTHCEVRHEKGKWVLQDLRSTNGTNIYWGENNHKILKQTDETFVVINGCGINVGASWITFLPQKLSGAGMECVEADKRETNHTVGMFTPFLSREGFSGTIFVGRSRSAHGRSLLLACDRVSHTHFCISYDNQYSWGVTDEGSTNGTKVMNENLRKETVTVPLWPGCVVRIGHTAKQPAPSYTFVFKVKP